MDWYWNSRPGKSLHRWYGVSISKGPFRFSLLWIPGPRETVTSQELYRRLLRWHKTHE